MIISENHPLRSHNTFAVEATAVYYIEIESEEDVVRLARDEFFRTLPFISIGSGSNLLFLGDFKGAVLHYAPSRVQTIAESEEDVVLHVESGKNWHLLVLETAKKGLWGLENLALIPGEVGAAAVQNIGAYGREISDVIRAVHVVDLRTGNSRILSTKEMSYDYRHSRLKESDMGHFLVTGVDLVLSKIPKPELSYKGLSDLATQEDLTPMHVVDAVVDIRGKKLPDPVALPNAGSFFMNPFISLAEYKTLLGEYPDLPGFPVGEDMVKVPAARLIQECGLKGVKSGNVGTYPNQPLVLVNYGGATGREIANFSEEIQKAVFERFGIALTPEVRFVKSATQHSVEEMAE